jgi:uncharacterized membrane protein YoaK (UPF0700 family)
MSAPSVDSSFGTKLLPSVLSLTAGSVDVITLLGLGGLFTAHITGNLVMFGLSSLALPAGLALFALALSFAAKSDDGTR